MISRPSHLYFVLSLLIASSGCLTTSAPEDSVECGAGSKKCASGQVCISHTCFNVCESNSQCETGFLCDDEVCKPDSRACQTSEDCDSGEFCQNNRTCVEKFALGTACTANLECGSQFCVDDVCCNSACSLTIDRKSVV